MANVAGRQRAAVAPRQTPGTRHSAPSGAAVGADFGHEAALLDSADGLSPAVVLALQKAAGNWAVQRQLGRWTRSPMGPRRAASWPAFPDPSGLFADPRAAQRPAVQRQIKIGNSFLSQLPAEEEERLHALGFSEAVITQIKRLASMKQLASLPEMRNWVQVANWLVREAPRPAASAAPVLYPKELKASHAETIVELIKTVRALAELKLEPNAVGDAAKLVAALAAIWRQLPYRKVIASAPLELATALKRLTIIADGLAMRPSEGQKQILELVQVDLRSPGFGARLTAFQRNHLDQRRVAVDEGEPAAEKGDASQGTPLAKANEAVVPSSAAKDESAFPNFDRAFLQTFQTGAYFDETLKRYLDLFQAVKDDSLAVVQVLAMFSEWYKNLPNDVKDEIDKRIEDPALKAKYDELSEAKRRLKQKNEQTIDVQDLRIEKMRTEVKERERALRELRQQSGGAELKKIEGRLLEIKSELESIEAVLWVKNVSDATVAEKLDASFRLKTKKDAGTRKGQLVNERKELIANKSAASKGGNQDDIERGAKELKELRPQLEAEEENRQTIGKRARTSEWEFEEKHQLRKLHNTLITSIIKNVRNLLVHNLDFFATAKRTFKFLQTQGLQPVVDDISAVIGAMLGSGKLVPGQLQALQGLQSMLLSFGEESAEKVRSVMIHKQLVSLDELAKLNSVVPKSEGAFTDADRKFFKYAKTTAPLEVGKHIVFETKLNEEYVNVKRPVEPEASGFPLRTEHDIVRYLDAIAVSRTILGKLREFMNANKLTGEQEIAALYQNDPFEMLNGPPQALVTRLKLNVLLEALGESIRPIADQALGIDLASVAKSEPSFAALVGFIDALRDFRNSSTHSLEWKNSIGWIKTLILLDANLPDLNQVRGRFLDQSLKQMREQAAAMKPEGKEQRRGKSETAAGWINYVENKETFDAFLKEVDAVIQEHWIFLTAGDAKLVVMLADRSRGGKEESGVKREDPTPAHLVLLFKALVTAVERYATQAKSEERLKGEIDGNRLVILNSPTAKMLLSIADAEFVDPKAVEAFGAKPAVEVEYRFLEAMGIPNNPDYTQMLAIVHDFCHEHGWKTTEEAAAGGASDALWKAADDAKKALRKEKSDKSAATAAASNVSVVEPKKLPLTPTLGTIHEDLREVTVEQGTEEEKKQRWKANVTLMDALIAVALEGESLGPVQASQMPIGSGSKEKGATSTQPSAQIGTPLRVPRETSPSGNCLYEAVSIALGNRSDLAGDYREIATAWLSEGNNASKLAMFGGVDIDALVDVISTPGRWAGAEGDLAPTVLATIVQHRIIVVTRSNAYAVDPLSVPNHGEVVVFYRNHHYTVNPPSDIVGWEKWETKTFKGSTAD